MPTEWQYQSFLAFLRVVHIVDVNIPYTGSIRKNQHYWISLDLNYVQKRLKDSQGFFKNTRL